MSRVLWTLPYFPWPLTSGGKVRQFHLLAQMHRLGHSITLLVQSKTPVDAIARNALEPLLERLIVVPRRPLRSATTFIAGAVSPLPLLTSINGYSAALSKAFESLLSQSWDVIQIEHSYSAQPFLAALSAHRRPFVVTEHNVESALGDATYGKWPRLLRPLASYDRWRTRAWERRVLSRAERVIAVSRDDAQALGAICGRPVDVVGNGVDSRAFASVVPDVASHRVLFIGNFEYAPNVDAVEWALSDIMPRVWQRLPQARFVVCGHALPRRWAREHDDSRIVWQGYVPKLQTIQGSCAAFLAPLRHGGGSKLKVLEALAAGLPLVSTREGVSGLDVADGVDALIADEGPSLADALTGILSMPQRARAIGEAGRSFVRSRHDWTSCADELEAVYGRLSGSRLAGAVAREAHASRH